MPQDDTNRPRPKDAWDKCDIAIRAIAVIAIPFVIAIVGNSYNASIKDSENRVRYVELAIAQLRSPPTHGTAALREWAVEVLDSQSPVKLTDAAKAQLKSGVLPLVISATAHGGVSTGNSSASGGEATATLSRPPREP